MAKGHKSNTSSSSQSTTKASAPSPSHSSPTSIPTNESNSPEKSPSSDSPPSPSQPPPSPPPPPRSSPPSPSHSPPPSPSPSPPPPKQASPPPTSPPPSKNSPPSPPPSSPPPTQTPSPSPPPPTPPSSSPPSPPSPPSTQPPNTDSPPPSESPPSPQVTTPPPSGSYASPPLPPQTHPPPPQSPLVSSGSNAKPSNPTPKTNGPSSSPSSSNFTTGGYIGLTFAALAFIAIIVFMILRRKDKRGNAYGSMPPPNKSQMKGDVHYYVEESGFVNGGGGAQDMLHSTMNHAGGVQHLEIPPDPAQQQQMSAGPIVFCYDKIVEITNGFSGENVIGEGGFGRVYKASMPDGRVGAVKLLKAGSGQGEREFKAEVEIISRVHHRHLVSLIGYCISEQQRVLIYEFVPNGNLDQHLHASEGMVLDWPKRMKIAIGAARGLAYLHEGCNPKIIHRDIKSANILLDDAYEAQVADFGLARLTNDANTHVSTRVMGTFGYMAPEYATSGKLTDRSDVFSFGVVLLELVTGRKPVDPDQPVGDESLVEWARPFLLRAIETGDFTELVDPRLNQQYVDTEMFRMIEAAAACVRHSGPKRPRMVQIARALDSGDQLYDLSNGVKYGQSTVYDSGQYNEEIRRFNGREDSSFGDSEYDLYSREYNSRDMSGPSRIPIQSPTSGDSDIRAFQGQRSNADNRS